MKSLSYVSILVAGLLVSEARADVECVFSTRSTNQGLESLDSHSFRVATGATSLKLEERAADGSWIDWGDVERIDLVDYLVFQHHPRVPDGNPSTLTIHRSGQATLLRYVDPYRPWLYYGECTEN